MKFASIITALIRALKRCVWHVSYQFHCSSCGDGDNKNGNRTDDGNNISPPVRVIRFAHDGVAAGRNRGLLRNEGVQLLLSGPNRAARTGRHRILKARVHRDRRQQSRSNQSISRGTRCDERRRQRRTVTERIRDGCGSGKVDCQTSVALRMDGKRDFTPVIPSAIASLRREASGAKFA